VGRHALAIALFTLPAVLLWWDVWAGHPASSLTCACGDPAQEVWFMAWPAWAVTHLHGLFFSGAVNVPNGANLLSNTAGTLVGLVLAPVTWTFGPIVSTNVALTLAPALSAWGCWVALRPLVAWKPLAIPSALVYGYSSAVVTSLMFGHVSVTVLVIPPLVFATLHEILIRQEHSIRRDGLLLAALMVVQFLISPEIMVMCVLMAGVAVAVVAAVGWRQVRARAAHAAPSLALAVGVTVALLAYPAWFGLAGPQAVTGVLFALAPISGVTLSGILSPGPYAAVASTYVRFGGYTGHNGPPPDFIGPGLALLAGAAAVLARRRAVTWLLLCMTFVALWLSFGSLLLGGPHSWAHIWLPWRELSRLPVLQEILPDQFAPFITLFLAFVLALGLDAAYVRLRRAAAAAGWAADRLRTVAAAGTAAVALLAMVPVFLTFEPPLTVVPVQIPAYVRQVAPTLPAGTVLLTIPFAVSGSTPPMLWQAVDDMHFRLAGGALKTPNALGGPVGQGVPGSARRILTNLTLVGAPEPRGTPAQLAAVRNALQAWQVNRVVITGVSRDPVYAAGFFTMALGVGPTYAHGAYTWTLPSTGVPAGTPATGGSLFLCRAYAARPSQRGDPLAVSQCLLAAANRG
jgi:hypothetical protein